MSVGNIIGANVIDLTMILPVCSAVSGGRLLIGATDQCAGPACLFDALRGVGAAAVADRAVLPLAGGADAGAVRRIRGAFGAVRLLRAGGRMGEISLRPASGYYFIFST